MPPPPFVPASGVMEMDMPDDVDFSDERVYAPNSSYANPPLKDGAVLIWSDANMSPVRPRPSYILFMCLTPAQEEKRSTEKNYTVAPAVISAIGFQMGEEMRGKKRARAEDFL